MCDNIKKLAIYPGTFDPITYGHLDIIQRAAPLFERIIVTLAVHAEKQPLFTVDERLELIRQTTAAIPNIEVATFRGLVVEYAAKVGASVIIRGLRALSDFEYEFQMALTNRKLSPVIDTVFLMPDEKYTYLSSSIVREIARHNGNMDCFVPTVVLKSLKQRFANQQLG